MLAGLLPPPLYSSSSALVERLISGSIACSDATSALALA
jgi:hypothetical protein